ncbi:hypothetical protein HJB53_30150 [Rhizobium lentis]|uniref:hypothetical protein n=1 Tax=Rhizobium lentis TaxID=1138194 RepID=UPI001C829DD8|nr:hypothetical protein [Rhizobium lentis]MBX5130754.1 hypothetical protein [Rhizobium lentis]
MKKQRNRQRSNQKQSRQKQAKPVTSSDRPDKWSRSYQATNALHLASLAAAMGSFMARRGVSPRNPLDE